MCRSSSLALAALAAFAAPGSLALRAQSSAGAGAAAQLHARAHAWAKESCEKNLWMTMDTCLKALDDNTTYIITGDIDAMWTRDSTAQVWPYLTMLEAHAGKQQEDEAPPLQRLSLLLQGALRRQAKFLLTDPYANAYTDKWGSEKDTRLGRGGYVFTGNFEVDSGVYFMRFLARMAELEVQGQPQGKPGKEVSAIMMNTKTSGKASATTSLYQGYSLVTDPTLREAVTMLVALYRQERDHALGKSQYRYPLSEPWELPGDDGQGAKANWTGMVWGAFRPSDDAQQLPYNIPNNLFLASVLEPMSKLAEDHWDDSAKLVANMRDLRSTILEGVKKHGLAPAPAATAGRDQAQKKPRAVSEMETSADAEQVYCYEVDGLGNCLLMDDANVPSLLSLPYLDPSGKVYDDKIYKRTRQFVLSEANPWYFSGKDGAGIGSPHTGDNMIWPLALVMQAMTAPDAAEKASTLARLYSAQSKSAAKNGLSESFAKDDASAITREWFAWPNALLAEHLMLQPVSACAPSLADLEAHLPKKTTEAKVKGAPFASPAQDFYHADSKLLRREGVVLPAKEYYSTN